jgi:murein DD-endopeptidase MepM/ murein hydrolase activator NlpD
MNGPQDTARLDRILRRAARRHHTSLQRAMLRDAGPFPLAGPAVWSNDWHAYRSCPVPHLHEGQDIIAPMGTPIVAIANSTVIGKGNDPSSSGEFVEIRKASGMEYFYCHLSRFAPGLAAGQRVRRGQLLGYVGMTGDATGPHLHLQVEPGGVPAPPKPWIDRWLLIAEHNARVMAGMTRAHTAAARTSATRRLAIEG